MSNKYITLGKKVKYTVFLIYPRLYFYLRFNNDYIMEVEDNA